MSEAPPEILSLEEVRSALDAPASLERFATVHGHPLLVVDWPGDSSMPTAPSAENVQAFATKLAALPCVTVAVTTGPETTGLEPLLSSFDVRVSGAAELAAVREVVSAHPMASLAFVQLLRGATRRSVEEGLVAESMAYSMLQSGPEFAAWRAARPLRDIEPDPSGPVAVRRDAATLFVELDRPRRHNAFSRDMRDGLCEAFELAAADHGIEQVVWSGRGPSFCSGGDLDEFGRFPDPVTAHAIRTTRSPARAVAAIAAKLEVRVHGACMGAGVELPAFAQRVVAAPDARFSLPELSLGLVPGAGGTVSLPPRIGRQATARLALLGGSIGADEALAIGLVDAIEQSRAPSSFLSFGERPG